MCFGDRSYASERGWSPYGNTKKILWRYFGGFSENARLVSEWLHFVILNPVRSHIQAEIGWNYPLGNQITWFHSSPRLRRDSGETDNFRRRLWIRRRFMCFGILFTWWIWQTRMWRFFLRNLNDKPADFLRCIYVGTWKWDTVFEVFTRSNNESREIGIFE